MNKKGGLPKMSVSETIADYVKDNKKKMCCFDNIPCKSTCEYFETCAASQRGNDHE